MTSGSCAVSVRRKTTKDHAWRAWSGDPAELRRVGAIFSDLVDQRRAPLWATYEPSPDALPVTLERHASEFQAQWRAVAKLRDGDDEIEGPIEAVLAELDPRSFCRIEFVAMSAGTAVPADGLVLVFNARNQSFPVSLSAHSSDAGWARQALALLSEEIDKGVPRWAPLRSFRGTMMVGLIVWAAVYALMLLVLPSAWSTVDRTTLAGIVSVVAGVGVQHARISNWFFPPLEVTTAGGNSGTRRIAGLGGLLLTVPLGVLVNLLTD
jgi:hypothetical protein